MSTGGNSTSWFLGTDSFTYLFYCCWIRCRGNLCVCVTWQPANNVGLVFSLGSVLFYVCGWIRSWGNLPSSYLTTTYGTVEQVKCYRASELTQEGWNLAGRLNWTAKAMCTQATNCGTTILSLTFWLATARQQLRDKTVTSSVCLFTGHRFVARKNNQATRMNGLTSHNNIPCMIIDIV
jgi:hypothetical protein